MGLGLANAYGAVAGRKALKDIIAEREMAAIDEQQRSLQEQTIRAQSGRADEQLALQRRAQQRLEEADKAEADRQWYEQMRATNAKETADISMENALKGVDPSRANVLRAVYKAGGKVGADDIMPTKKRKDVSFYVNGREQHGSYDESTGQYFDAQGKQVLNPGGKPPEPKAPVGAKGITESATDNDKIASTARGTIDVIKGLIDPASKSLQPGVTDIIGGFDQWLSPEMVGMVPGAHPDAAMRANIYRQLTDQLFMQGVQQMRGMGALSDAEGKKIAGSVSAMGRNLSPEKFQKTVMDVYETVEKALRTVKLPGGGTYTFKTVEQADAMRERIKAGG